MSKLPQTGYRLLTSRIESFLSWRMILPCGWPSFRGERYDNAFRGKSNLHFRTVAIRINGKHLHVQVRL
jgi:hypothetical protein